MGFLDDIFGGNQVSGRDARLGRNDQGFQFQSQPQSQQNPHLGQRGSIGRRPTGGVEGLNLSGLNLFNATKVPVDTEEGPRLRGEIRPQQTTISPSQQIAPGRLDPNSPLFESSLHDALDFLSLGDTSGQTLNQQRAAGINPFQQAGASVGIAQADPDAGGATGFQEGLGVGGGQNLNPNGSVDLSTQTAANNAGITSGGAVQQNTGGGIQQGGAADDSLMALIASLIQSLLASGQFAAGGGVGQQQQGQPVFRSDLNRLGVNRF